MTKIAAITPYYLPARPDELVAHFCRIKDAAPDQELYSYIFPERTGLHVSPDVFARLAEAAQLAGAKASGSAAAELAGYAAAAPGARIFSGNDSNPAAVLAAGGAGVVSGRSGAWPEVYGAIAAALAAGEIDAAARHQQRLDRIVALGASIGRVKHVLQLRGRGGSTARMTVDPPDAATAAALGVSPSWSPGFRRPEPLARFASVIRFFSSRLLFAPVRVWSRQPTAGAARHL